MEERGQVDVMECSVPATISILPSAIGLGLLACVAGVRGWRVWNIV